jgi:hypothetical protein
MAKVAEFLFSATPVEAAPLRPDDARCDARYALTDGRIGTRFHMRIV